MIIFKLSWKERALDVSPSLRPVSILENRGATVFNAIAAADERLCRLNFEDSDLP